MVKGTTEIFWRKVQSVEKGECPPTFDVNGISFIHVYKKGLYLVFTTKFNVSPVFALELLAKFASVFKDYTGNLSEMSLRANFVLVYEILDELLDYGWVQSTSSDHLRSHVVTAPSSSSSQSSSSSSSQSGSTPGGGIKSALAKLKARAKRGILVESSGGRRGAVTTSSASAEKPISMEARVSGEDEVFVDLLERLIVVFGKDGSVVRSQIDGSVQVKAFVSGSPQMILALNADLNVGSAGEEYGIVVDDISFHESVNLDEFDAARIVAFTLSAGESTLMSYRLKSEFRIPFRVFVFLEEASPSSFDVVLKIRADFPDSTFGKDVAISVPLPPTTYNATLDLPQGTGVGGQSYSYSKDAHTLTWLVPKFRGGSEHHARIRVHLEGPEEYASWSSAVGPASLSFEIPMHSLSGVSIQSLRIVDPGNRGYKPARWVRYVSHSDSYICRV